MSGDTCDLLCLDLPRAERVRDGLPSADALDVGARVFKALADPTRAAIVLALHRSGACCVCDLGWIVGRDEKLVSHHVRLLRNLGVARSRREGRMVIYELTDVGERLATQFADITAARA